MQDGGLIFVREEHRLFETRRVDLRMLLEVLEKRSRPASGGTDDEKIGHRHKHILSFKASLNQGGCPY